MAKALLLAWSSPALAGDLAEYQEWYEKTHSPGPRHGSLDQRGEPLRAGGPGQDHPPAARWYRGTQGSCAEIIGLMTTTRRLLAPLRPAARVLTGSTYALLGFDALRAPGARVDQAAGVLAAARTVLPLPADDELVVRGNAAVQVLAGTALALGLAPRLSALALAGSLVPTTLAGHAYWTIEDPAARKLQRIQFHKNLALIGGLLFAALDEPQDAPAFREPRATSVSS
jgi:putative oxidoreductase